MSDLDPLGIRSALVDDLRTQCAELKNALRIASDTLLDSDAKIRELEQDKCGLAADALNARQLLREFMAYVKCGQVPEDAHCARRAKQLLDSNLLDARVREGGGGGGSEPPPRHSESGNK